MALTAAAVLAAGAAGAPPQRFPADYLLKGFSGAPWDFELPPTELQTEGAFPSWLVGTLYRNGPGQWNPSTPCEQGACSKDANWFVGVAMFHSFHIGKGGKVVYRSHFPRTTPFKKYTNDSSLVEGGANAPNTAVTIAHIDGELVATTASAAYNSFDPETLRLKEAPFQLDDKLGLGVTIHGGMAPSHVHNMPDGSVVGYAEKFVPPMGYVVWEIPKGTRTRRPVATLKAHGATPAYNHMFAATTNYVAVLEQPCGYGAGVNVITDGTADMFKDFTWQPEKGTRLRLVDRRTGEETVYPLSRNTQMLHTVNAYETDRNTVVVDIADHQYPIGNTFGCAKFLRAEYLSVIINGTKEKADDLLFPETISGQVVRIEAPLDQPGATATVTPLGPPECGMEVPTISYDAHNGQPYRYVYGAGIWDMGASTMFDVLIKLDTVKGSCKRWHQDMHFPGEATFVPRPGATEEDDGVLLSVVIDASTMDHGKDYLIAFNATTMEEIGRAWLPSNSHYMFQYHGIFTFDP